MPINYMIKETKSGKARKAGKTARELYDENVGRMPIEEFVEAGYDAADLEGMFEKEEVLEASMTPYASPLLVKMLSRGGCCEDVDASTLARLLMGEADEEGRAGASSPLFDLARHASEETRKAVDLCLRRVPDLVGPAIECTVASPPRPEQRGRAASSSPPPLPPTARHLLGSCG